MCIRTKALFFSEGSKVTEADSQMVTHIFYYNKVIVDSQFSPIKFVATFHYVPYMTYYYFAVTIIMSANGDCYNK